MAIETLFAEGWQVVAAGWLGVSHIAIEADLLDELARIYGSTTISPVRSIRRGSAVLTAAPRAKAWRWVRLRPRALIARWLIRKRSPTCFVDPKIAGRCWHRGRPLVELRQSVLQR
jgi:hypothetical protein